MDMDRWPDSIYHVLILTLAHVALSIEHWKLACHNGDLRISRCFSKIIWECPVQKIQFSSIFYGKPKPNGFQFLESGFATLFHKPCEHILVQTKF
jgi:hypothetical protein